jgi:hypothetical protein
MGNHMYLLDCYAEAPQNVLPRICFGFGKASFQSTPVCFSLPAFFTEKPKKLKQTPPELGFAFPFYISGIAQRKERDQRPRFTPEVSRRSSNADEDRIEMIHIKL